MSALVRLADAHRSDSGFVVFVSRCQRPSCSTPIVRVVQHDGDPATSTKWCSETCTRWSRRASKASPIVMVNGQCHGCRKWTTEPERQAYTRQRTDTRYCSTRCRTQSQYVPCEACSGRYLRSPSQAVCASCFHTAAVSCAGKDRFGDRHVAAARISWYRKKDRRRAGSNDLVIYTCWACGFLHVGNGDTGENSPAARAAALLRQRLGPDLWQQLVDRWSTQKRVKDLKGPVVKNRRRSAGRGPAQ